MWHILPLMSSGRPVPDSCLKISLQLDYIIKQVFYSVFYKCNQIHTITWSVTLWNAYAPQSTPKSYPEWFTEGSLSAKSCLLQPKFHSRTKNMSLHVKKELYNSWERLCDIRMLHFFPRVKILTLSLSNFPGSRIK